MSLVDTAGIAPPAGAGGGQEAPAASTMTLFEHLGELRRRLLVSLIALVAATVAAWFLYGDLLHFMIAPYHSYLLHHPAKDVSGGNLVTTAPLEGFTTRLRISGYAGVVMAAPVWLWQLWRFVAPGLYRRERRPAVAFAGAAIVLFVLGVLTAVAVFPKAIDWMISVSGPGVVPLFSPSRYLGLYALACVVFGSVFTYPVFLVGMQVAGLVSSARLRSWRRYAIVVCCAVAAVITPSSDPFSFVAMAVPMVIFYEAAIVAGRLLGR